MSWWQNLPSLMQPELFTLFGFPIRWYGLMYIVALMITYLLGRYRLRHDNFPYTETQLSDFIMWVLVGIMVGGRLGYILFYDLAYFLQHPLQTVLPFSFEGGFRITGISGMSYHGGVLGVLVATLLFVKWQNKKAKADPKVPRVSWGRFIDMTIAGMPLGYFFGRIGNFINGELYGRSTDVAWGMYFPTDPTGQLRHPSQLYEAFFEGIFLFAILWTVRNRSLFPGFLAALYITGYGTVRFFIEFFRKPDEHLGTVLGPFSMGQVLCLVMIAVGSAAIIWGLRHQKKQAVSST